MINIVSITSQGQITIPVKIRKQLDLKKGGKAVVSIDKGKMFVSPVGDFLELGGFLKTSKKFPPRKIRQAFGDYLASEANK